MIESIKRFFRCLLRRRVQIQNSGSNSVNIQTNGDLKIPKDYTWMRGNPPKMKPPRRMCSCVVECDKCGGER